MPQTVQPYLANQFGMPLYGISGIMPFTGNQFWVDQTNGNDGNTGGPQDPFRTLSKAHDSCVNNNNDVVFLTGTVNITGTLTWSKSRTHLIGLAPNLLSQARARISQTGSTVFSPLMTVSGSECIFRDIGLFHGFANASTQICLNVTGGRNEFTRCLIGGMGATLAAAQAGSRSLVLAGVDGENTFRQCQIGLDTITRAAANASLEFTGGNPRNTFDECIFPILTSDATAVFITVGASGVDRFNWFKRCVFVNAMDSGSIAMTVGITMNVAAGGSLILQASMMIGATDLGNAGGFVNMYIDMAAPAPTTGGLAVNPS